MPQNPLIARVSPPLALYVHFPWCIRKCPYCDFNSHAHGPAVDERAYVAALLLDLEQEQDGVADREPGSLFIGGGTPSLIGAGAIRDLLQGIRERVPLAPDAEVSLEANPGAVDSRRFDAYRRAGVNRLSIGVQSFDEEKLNALGRIHGPQEAEEAYVRARAAGFANVNLDLMFGLPGQSVQQAMADLERAIALNPEHLSWYQLTIEPNTLFHHQPPVTPDEELLWEMQQLGWEKLAAEGYHQYEVSAYAREGLHCRHNYNYWAFGDYLGIGAGAHGKLTTPGGIFRTWKARSPAVYQEALFSGRRTGERKLLSVEDLSLEFMLNALRLTEGVAGEVFSQRTGLPLRAVAAALQDARGRGLMVPGDERLQTTELGRRFLDDLVALFA